MLAQQIMKSLQPLENLLFRSYGFFILFWFKSSQCTYHEVSQMNKVPNYLKIL